VHLCVGVLAAVAVFWFGICDGAVVGWFRHSQGLEFWLFLLDFRPIAIALLFGFCSCLALSITRKEKKKMKLK